MLQSISSRQQCKVFHIQCVSYVPRRMIVVFAYNSLHCVFNLIRFLMKENRERELQSAMKKFCPEQALIISVKQFQ